MLILPLPAGYLVGMAVWLLAMLAMLVGLVRLRRAGRRRRWLARLVPVGLSLWMLLACVTALELGFAAFFAESDALNVTNVARRWHAIHVAPQIDELGLRSRHDPASTLLPGRERIAFVGDSFTFGHGVPRMADRFSDRVEAALEAGQPGRFAVDNFGVPGHDVTAVAAQVEALFAHGYRPRLVVYVWQVNDLEQLDPRTWASVGGFTRARSEHWLVRDTWFVNWLYYRVLLGSRAVSTYFDDLRAAYEGPAFARGAAILDGLQQTCSAHGAELRLVVFPFLHGLGPDYAFRAAHERLVAHARARGLRALDLAPVLAPHRDEGLVVNGRDSHPNERAHALAATAITAQLLDDLLAPAAGR
ncbi:MAG: SGNH/GDSL hydrolase family protein [Planctomycetes bacterium]|nr:SGNH/GDSL hydrolase family protein [Planctomycetota bacterium]